MLLVGSTARGHSYLVIRAAGSPIREQSTAMSCSEDRAGSAPPAARTAQGPPSAKIRPIPRLCKVSEPSIGSYTHRGTVALATTLRAVPIAFRSAKPAQVGLRVAHAPFAIPSSIPSPMRACPSSVCPRSVSGSRCLRRRRARVPAAHERSASAVAVRGSSTLSSQAARVGWTLALRVARDPAAPHPIRPTRLVPVDAEAHHRGGLLHARRGSPAARRIVLALDTVRKAGPVRYAWRCGAPRANLVLRHPPRGRAASSAQRFRLPDASVSITKKPRTDPFSSMRSPASSREYSRCGNEGQRLKLLGVEIGGQKHPMTPAACSGSFSNTSPTRSRRRPCPSAAPPVPPSPHHRAARRGDPARWGSVICPAALASSRLHRERPETSRRDVKRCPAVLEGWSGSSAPTAMFFVIPCTYYLPAPRPGLV
ncbi:hypothetical protein AURDEDRAFT_174701 [Auricularia subglabra TFB-10046 SS5]|nr:hypothetical protein AURDEDRAFT_174701 [Auricularia subglabra TFB-10046 SS5]